MSVIIRCAADEQLSIDIKLRSIRSSSIILDTVADMQKL